MASWYGTTATTNLRKVHVIDVEDLSEDSHTMEYLAGEHVLSSTSFKLVHVYTSEVDIGNK
jgi:hypothetical protein